MQKVQPAKNTLDMDFLNSMNKSIGGNAAQTTATVTAPVTPLAEKEPETIIDPVEMSTDFDSEISIDDDVPVSKTIKAKSTSSSTSPLQIFNFNFSKDSRKSLKLKLHNCL